MTIVLDELDTVARATRPRIRATYGTRTAPHWRYDVPAIEQACERLGVRGCVRIYLSESRRGRWQGSQCWDERADEHVIMLARWLSPAEASRTLWHELTHCAQTERGDELFTNISSSARARMAEAAYRALPGEREAMRNERLGDRYRLVSPR